MLESLMFMVLMILGGITIILSVIIIIIGLGKKQKLLRNIGLGIGIIPIICFCLIAYWYGGAIPTFNNNQMTDFAGIYLPTESTKNILIKNNQLDKSIKLVLNPDGTYEFTPIQGIGLKKSGIWETGGIDGHFNFYDELGNLIDFGMPAGSGENCILSFQFRPNQDEFFETENIYFKKTK